MIEQKRSYSVAFTRLFTRGNLIGLTHIDWLEFPTIESRSNWIEGVKKNIALGELDWKFAKAPFFYAGWEREESLEDYKMWG